MRIISLRYSSWIWSQQLLILFFINYGIAPWRREYYYFLKNLVLKLFIYNYINIFKTLFYKYVWNESNFKLRTWKNDTENHCKLQQVCIYLRCLWDVSPNTNYYAWYV